MEKFKAFCKRKNIEVSAKRYGIDALGAMAQGLFCSLLIGTIIKTLGAQLGVPFLTDIGTYAMSVSGPAMAVAIGYALKLSVVIGAILCFFGIFVFHIAHITVLVFGVMVIFGLGTGGVYYIPWTAYTFMADVDEVVTNRRREGVYAGAMTMAGKLMRASVVFILGQVLAAFGFVSGASTQPQSAVNAIAGVLLVGVGGLAIIGIVFSCRMKLNHKTHKIVIDELDRVHAGGRKEDVSEETRSVIEKLTGISYDKCFGNNNIGYKE